MALFVPPISDYKPFYIQFATGAAKNILTEYSVVIKAHDYPSAFRAKEPYKNQWKDENGDEEYISPDGLFVEAFTFKLECAMFARGASEAAAIEDLKTGIRAFQNALKGGFFKTYDAWTGFGFQDVRLVEFPTPSENAYSSWDDATRVIFSVTVKVNDPVTLMKLQNGSIVEA